MGEMRTKAEAVEEKRADEVEKRRVEMENLEEVKKREDGAKIEEDKERAEVDAKINEELDKRVKELEMTMEKVVGYLRGMKKIFEKFGNPGSLGILLSQGGGDC